MATTKQTSPAQTIRDYFDRLGSRDLDGASEYWTADTVEEMVPDGVTLAGPDQLRAYFAGLFAAFPDFAFEVERTIEEGDHVVVQWRATGTFTGAKFQGLAPTGAAVTIRGADLFQIKDGKIFRNSGYFDGASVARQIGVMPPAGSGAEKAMLAAVNGLTALRGSQTVPVERRAPGQAPPPPEGEVGVQELFDNYIQGHKNHDVPRIAAHWHEDGRGEVAGGQELDGPAGMAQFFNEMIQAFPDWNIEVERTVAQDPFVSMQWRVTGTFTGGRFQGLAPNGRSVELRGLDVFEADGNRFRSATVYFDTATMMRQLGVLPAQGSGPDKAMTGAFNGATKVKDLLGR